MTAGVQCETRRKFSPQPSGKWLYVIHPPAAEMAVMASLGIGPREDPLTFCRLRCLAEWAYVQLAVGEPATGKEPS